MDHQVVRSEIAVPTGKSTVRAHFERSKKNGTLTLSINGKECGSIPIPYLLFIISSTGMDIGQDSLSPVTDDYEGPFKFPGIIHRVVIDMPKYTGRRTRHDRLGGMSSGKKMKAEERKEAEANHRTEMYKQ